MHPVSRYKTEYPIPTIQELKAEYWPDVPFSIEDIVKARWIGNKHAPNGTDELLAWILIAADEIHRMRAKLEQHEADEQPEPPST
jgi:hypothetical protein